MATAEFYMVHITRASDVTYEQLEKIMNQSLDWYRINENLWILYTTSNAEKWHERLKPTIKESGRLFICKLDVSARQGWMDKGFWAWLRREKT
jgi:hypothetical protein